jgi:hypothetical protein
MVILLRCGRAIAFPKIKHCEIEQEGNFPILRLKTNKDNKSFIASFNWDAVAGVMNDEDYANTLGAEMVRNLGRRNDDSPDD